MATCEEQGYLFGFVSILQKELT